MQYIDNFEIIDKDFYTFLLQKFGNELKWFHFSANYVIIEEKIFLIINYDREYQTKIYEIISINPEGGDIIVEYLIEVINPYNKFFNDIKSLNLIIAKFILTNGIKRLLSMKNPIEVYKDVCLRLYPINDILRQNINENQNIKFKKRSNNLTDNNKNNNRILSSSQITGFNNIQNLQPQIVTNNIFSQTQFNSENKNNLTGNINTINPQEKHYNLINNNKHFNNNNAPNNLHNNNNLKDLMNKLNEEKEKNEALKNELYIVKKKVKELTDREEKTIAVVFISLDKRLHFPMSCKISDIFEKLEEKLYLEYPDYKKENTYFITNGKLVIKSETLEKNGIKNGDSIIVNSSEYY